MSEFDPAGHRMVPQQRWFEDFTLGERFVIPSRTMTTAVFAAFQTASGDTHPIHYDVEYCRARGMPNLLAHGFQTLIHTAPGAGLFPYLVEESLVGFLEQSSRFLKPVFADDTIYPALEVTELTPGRSTGVLTCARACTISAANWCWRACRNSSFAGGRSDRRAQNTKSRKQPHAR
jgi:acyl dehydratase